MMLTTKFPGIINHQTFLLIICGVFFLTTVRAQHTPLSYIDANKDKAIAFMQEYGLPASIILAVAMHESANGNSRVARYLNNHFGIKGKNNSKVIRSAYKGYGSVDESYQDFVSLLQSRKAFSQLFDQCAPHDYRAWAKGIARGGYAHSSSWASKVIGMIEKYRLHEYDDPPNRPADDTMPAPPDETAAIYFVQRGDTLSYIARQYQTTVEEIMEKNQLSSARLQIGQKLVL
jgi:hypothetical protein